MATRRGGRARERRARSPRSAPTASAVFPADDAHTPLWRELRRRAPRRSTFALDDAGRRRGRARLARRPLARARCSTPAGAATLRRCASPARTTCATRWRRRACALAAGVPLEAIVRGLEAFAPVQRPLAGASAARRAARRHADRRHATTPIPIRCAPRSTCSPRCRRRAGWCWATWARSATRGRQFHREVGAYARERGIETLLRRRRR